MKSFGNLAFLILAICKVTGPLLASLFGGINVIIRGRERPSRNSAYRLLLEQDLRPLPIAALLISCGS
jgi:hypothetical protein